MAKLANTGQLLMDLYLQDFETDEDFFKLRDFMYICGVVYSKMLEDEYKESRKLSQQESGYTNITLAADWLTEVELEVKTLEDGSDDRYAEFQVRPFSFPYDQYGYGVQSVSNAVRSPGSCGNFVRESESIEHQMCELPPTKVVFWYPQGRRVILKNVSCKLDKIKVKYLQEITDPEAGPDGGEIAKSKEFEVITKALQLMKLARDGVVVDMSNNSNPNRTMATEIDARFDKLRNKPV